MDMIVQKPRQIPAYTVRPTCDRCGKTHHPAVRFYLTAASDRKPLKGFYPDLSVSLCRGCLIDALGTIEAAAD